MHINLTSEEVLQVYKKLLDGHVKNEPNDSLDSVLQKLENVILNDLRTIEHRQNIQSFDLWVNSEQNKIEGLNEELKKIRDTIPAEDLKKMFVPSNKLNKKRTTRKRNNRK